VLDKMGAADEGSARARLLSGRALAFEALSRWPEALADYNAALVQAVAAGYEQARRPRPLTPPHPGTVGESEGERVFTCRTLTSSTAAAT
jgi:hypothetical protein